MADVNQAVKELDNNKSRDAQWLANELFKDEFAETDLKQAILKLVNLIKERQEYPEAFKQSNIAYIYKHKGSHKDINHSTGVFRVIVFHSIIDRLIYKDSYY